MTTVDTSPPPASTERRSLSKLIWVAVSIVAAICWGVIALVRGEEVRRLAAGRSGGVLRDRLPLLLPIHRPPRARGGRHASDAG